MCRKGRAFGLWDGCWSLRYSHKFGLHVFPPCLNTFVRGLVTTTLHVHHGAGAARSCLHLKTSPISGCVGGSYIELDVKC